MYLLVKSINNVILKVKFQEDLLKVTLKYNLEEKMSLINDILPMYMDVPVLKRGKSLPSRTHSIIPISHKRILNL